MQSVGGKAGPVVTGLGETGAKVVLGDAAGSTNTQLQLHACLLGVCMHGPERCRCCHTVCALQASCNKHGPGHHPSMGI